MKNWRQRIISLTRLMKKTPREESEKRNRNPYWPVSEEAVQSQDKIFLFWRNLATFNGGSEVVHPAEAAALSAAQKPGSSRKRPPFPLAFSTNKARQQRILLWRPRPSLQPYLCTARQNLLFLGWIPHPLSLPMAPRVAFSVIDILAFSFRLGLPSNTFYGK